jgi:hypothetical protein
MGKDSDDVDSSDASDVKVEDVLMKEKLLFVD